MTRMISIHSSRGGTGKSLIASNLAAILASRGLNVALLDFDFRAPSLVTIFQEEKGSQRYMNDYIDGKAKLGEVMVAISERLGCGSTLRVGFADVELDAMREIARKDRKWQTRALEKVLYLKQELSDLMDASLILIDTSPGIQYSSVNAVVGSDLSMIIAAMYILDLEGSQRMYRALYQPFEKKALIVIKKAMPHDIFGESKNALIEDVLDRFSQPPLAIITCFFDILLSQRASLFVRDKPEHPFTWALNEIALRIEKIIQKWSPIPVRNQGLV